jgi:putative DNA primase/helicase
MIPEAFAAITAACADLGLSPPPHEVVIFDGKIYRYHCQIHDRHGEKNAWLKCCDNGDGSFGGTVGHWRLGCKRNWSSRSGRRFTQAERAEYAKKMQDARQRETEERERQYRRVAEKARRIWDKADRASRNHDYILKKQIEPRNIRQKGESILVPLRDSSGVLWSIQFINPAGERSSSLVDGCMPVTGASAHHRRCHFDLRGYGNRNESA